MTAKWQAERAKARGTARTRRAAIAMFAPHFPAVSTGSPAGPPDTVSLDGPGMVSLSCKADSPPTNPVSANPRRTAENAGDPLRPEKPSGPPARGLSTSETNIMANSVKSKTSGPVRPQPNVGAKVLKKITCAGLLPKGYEHPRGSGDLWLADFFCQVTGCKEETYDGRPYIRWLGDFRRVDCDTGEIVASSTAIFPDIASDRIEAAMLGGENAAGHRQNVQIAFRIGVTGEGRVGMQGYAWTLQTIMQPNYVAPIDRFVAECYQPAQALPAPEEQAMEEAAQ